MSIELILIALFVIVTFLFLQIVKVRRPQRVAVEQETGSSTVSSGENELMEVSELHENATLK